MKLYYLWSMDAKELNDLFDKTGTRQTDFIKWAATHGVVISRAAVSQHVTGAVRINKWAVMAYKWFFSFHGA